MPASRTYLLPGIQQVPAEGPRGRGEGEQVLPGLDGADDESLKGGDGRFLGGVSDQKEAEERVQRRDGAHVEHKPRPAPQPRRRYGDCGDCGEEDGNDAAMRVAICGLKRSIFATMAFRNS